MSGPCNRSRPRAPLSRVVRQRRGDRPYSPLCWLTFAPTRGRARFLTEVRRFSPVAVGRGVRVQGPHNNTPRALSFHAYVHTATDIAYPNAMPIAPEPPRAVVRLVVKAWTSVSKIESAREVAKRWKAIFRSRNIEMAPARFSVAVRPVMAQSNAERFRKYVASSGATEIKPERTR